MLQLVWKKRRGWDSNPRSLKARPLFESGTINHSDTSPSFRLYPKSSRGGKVANILLTDPDCCYFNWSFLQTLLEPAGCGFL